MANRDLPPIHPEEQLREEFMKPLGLAACRLAKDIDASVSRVQDLGGRTPRSGTEHLGRRLITPSTKSVPRRA